MPSGHIFGGRKNLETRRVDIGIGAIFQYSGSATTLISGVIFYLFIVNTFSQEFFAQIGILQAVLGLVSTVFTFGLTQAMQHFISNHAAKNENNEIHSVLRTTFIVLGTLALGAAATIHFLSPLLIEFFLHATGTPQAYSAVRAVNILAFATAAYISANVVNGMILGFQKFRTSGTLTILNALCSYGLAAFLVTRLMSVEAVVAGWAITYFLILIIGLTIVFRTLHNYPKIPTPTQQFNYKPVLRFAIPILLSSVVSFSSVYADRLIVAGLLTSSAFATYSFALLIASSVSFFVSPINNILLPKFSQFFSYNDSDSIRTGVRLTINVVTFIYAPIAVWIAVLGTPIIRTLSNANYVGGALPLAIILFVSAILVSQSVLVQGLQGIRITKIFVFSSVMSLMSNLVLSIILIPKIHLIGAAIGYSSVSLVNFTIIYHFARSFKVASYDMRTLTKIWSATIGVLAGIFLFSRFALPLQPFSSFLTGVPHLLVDGFYLMIYVVLGLLIYATVIRLTRGVSARDIEFFYTFMPKSLLFTKKILLVIFVGRRPPDLTLQLKA